MTFHMSLAGLSFALLLVASTDGWRMSLDGAEGRLVLAVAVLSFSLAFLAMFAGVRLIGASRTAMTMNLEPVFTLCLAFLVLDEQLSSAQFLGAALVIASIFLGNAVGKQQPSDPQADRRA